MAKNKWLNILYPGFDSKDVKHCQMYVDTKPQYKILKDFADIHPDDDLIIIGHGRLQDPDNMHGENGKKTDYNALACAVAQSLPNRALKFRIKLWRCHGSDVMPNGEGEPACFGGQFSSALKQWGCDNITVVSYPGIFCESSNVGYKFTIDPKVSNVNNVGLFAGSMTREIKSRKLDIKEALVELIKLEQFGIFAARIHKTVWS